MSTTETQRPNYYQRTDEPRVGVWYYAGLCVECRVCGVGVGEVCVTRSGYQFHAGEHKHHFWRYRDARHLIGRDLPGVEFIEVEEWKKIQESHNEPV